MNEGRELQAIARFVRWQLASRLASDGIVFNWLSGTRLVIRRGDTGLTGNVYCGLHEFEDMAFMLHLLRQTEEFVDVGANLGSWSVLAGGVCKARVFAFEPVPSTYRRLRDNLLINDLGEHVQAWNCALGEASGELKFTAGLDTMNHVFTDSDDDSRVIKVPVETVDRILGSASPTLVKIDVEGFELCVLKGARGLLSSRPPLAVILELNGSGRRYGHDDSDVIEFMSGFGYKPFSYAPAIRSLTPLSEVGFGGNTIFIRDESAVQMRLRSASRFSIGSLSF